MAERYPIMHRRPTVPEVPPWPGAGLGVRQFWGGCHRGVSTPREVDHSDISEEVRSKLVIRLQIHIN